MIAARAVRNCAQMACVDFGLAFELAAAIQLPTGPGFKPLADLIDRHGVDATRDILRRLLEADDNGVLVERPVVFTPLGKMA